MANIPLGIDFGSVYSRIAYYNQITSLPEIIPNQQGLFRTPSVVAIMQGEAVVGAPALAAHATSQAKCAAFFRSGLAQPGYVVQLDEGHVFTPTRLLGLVFAQLKRDAESHLRVAIRDVVIAVPTHFTALQRQAYMEAGQFADLNVLGLIPEPIAAVLTHGLEGCDTRQEIFVCNVGDGSTDVSVLECEGGHIQILATGGDNYLGEVDFDRVIANWIMAQHADFQGLATDDRLRLLAPQVETAKDALCCHSSTLVTLPLGERSYTVEVTRDQIEVICRSLVDQIERVCRKVIEDAHLSWSDLTAAILVGGSTPLPMIRERICQIIDRRIVSERHIEDAVALGAAIHAFSILQIGKTATRFEPFEEIAPSPGLAASIPFEVKEEIAIQRGTDVARIELCFGDLTNLQEANAVDVLVVSAYPNDYTCLPGSLMLALRDKGLSVAELARDKEVDLRVAFCCWMSRDLRGLVPTLHFQRLLCFEPFVRGAPSELVGDIFRSLAPFVGGQHQIRTVAMPIVASGYQAFPADRMLRLIVDAASHWMAIGLPLTCLKIACLPGAAADKLLEVFRELKVSISQRQTSPAREHKFHLFLSYAHANSHEVEWFHSALLERRADLRIFFDRQQLNAGAAWQQEIYESLDNCHKIVPFYTREYLASKVCIEEFNIALCRHRESTASILAPIYLYSAEPLPTYMKLIQFADCRENNRVLAEGAIAKLVDSL